MNHYDYSKMKKLATDEDVANLSLSFYDHSDPVYVFFSKIDRDHLKELGYSNFSKTAKLNTPYRILEAEDDDYPIYIKNETQYIWIYKSFIFKSEAYYWVGDIEDLLKTEDQAFLEGI